MGKSVTRKKIVPSFRSKTWNNVFSAHVNGGENMLISYIGIRELGIAHSPKYIRKLVRKGAFPVPARGGRNMGAFFWNYDDVVLWLKFKDPIPMWARDAAQISCWK